MRRPLFRVCALFALLLVMGSPAHATVMVLLSTSELAARSDVVVLASVRSVRSRLVLESDAARPYTFVELLIEQVEKGDVAVGEVLVLQEAGGAWVDGSRATIVGSPVFRVGERVFIFVQRAPHLSRGRYRTTAMAQGKFELHAKPSGDVAVRDLRGLSFATAGPLGGLSLRDGARERARPLVNILAEVRAGRR